MLQSLKLTSNVFYLFTSVFSQLSAISDSLQNGHAYTKTSGVQEHLHTPVFQVTQMGAGHGGEGADDRHGPPMRRRNTGREGMQQGWREPSGMLCSHTFNCSILS